MSKKSSENQVNITIDSFTVVKVLLMVVATLAALSFLKQIVQPLVLLFIAFFLAMALNPAVSKIASKLKSQSRVRATGAAYLLVIGFLIAFFAFVIPPLVRQTVDFIKEVPATIQDVKSNDSPLNEFVERYKLEEQVDKFTSDFDSHFGDIGRTTISTAGFIGSALANMIIVLVLAFMMLVEGPNWMGRFWALHDKKKRAHRRELVRKMYKVVTNFVNGQVLIAALSGIFASIALFILKTIFDAEINPIALGGIIALFALMPLIGTTIGSAIVFLACLLVSVPLAIAFGIFFLVYQQIENVTIQPYIQSRSNKLTPLIVFAAALIGASFGGLLGALVAIPAAGCIKVLVDDYLERRGESPLS